MIRATKRYGTTDQNTIQQVQIKILLTMMVDGRNMTRCIPMKRIGLLGQIPSLGIRNLGSARVNSSGVGMTSNTVKKNSSQTVD